MFLKKLSCQYFKNHKHLSLGFHKHINLIIGNNGSGKTNLLDAIYYLSMTKSAFNKIDTQNIQHGENFFMIQGDFHKQTVLYKVHCVVQKQAQKTITTNQAKYNQLSEHIGHFPIVLVSPYDVQIIEQGAEMRRSFFDQLLCQSNKNYLNILIQYQHILKQRNTVLKDYAIYHKLDHLLLNTYNQQLLKLGQYLFHIRQTLMPIFCSYLNTYYQYLGHEQIQLSYRSELFDQDFEKKFQKNLDKDLILQRTTMGIHQDDFIFSIDKHALKKFGSQGQQKTFIIALKLAQLAYIQKNKSITPLLLLDDIFDKLDESRIIKLVHLLQHPSIGQVFITEATQERATKVLSPLHNKMAIFPIPDNP